MLSTTKNPLVFSVELHSTNTYNSGYMRILEDGSIDGILTYDYFSIMPCTINDYNSEIFSSIIYHVLNLETNIPTYTIYRFESDNLFFEPILNVKNIARSLIIPDEYISLTLIEQIHNQGFIDKVCHCIDAVQAMFSHLT